MATTFFKVDRFVLIVGASLISLAIACGSDSEPAAPPTATAAPAPTLAPAPTAVPAPTATMIPTVGEIEITPLEYLGGVQIGGQDPIKAAAYYCPDGSGQVLNDPGNVYASGPEGKFQWHVEARPGSRWNDVVFVFLSDDPAYWDITSPDGTYSWSIGVDVDQATISASFPLGELRVTQN